MGTATITEWDIANDSAVGDDLTVDFDPQSLELSYSSTGDLTASSSTSSGARSKTPAQQTGQSATLTMTLLFDTTVAGTSVQERTDPLVRLTEPAEATGTQAPARKVLRFHWGSFLFFGAISTMTQTIDFFSASGVPLRSTVRLTVGKVDPPSDSSTGSGSQQAQPDFGSNADAGAGSGARSSFSATASFSAGAGGPVGTTPLTLSTAGDTVQAIAARAGGGISWKAVATANGIDNPRLLPPGTVLDARAGAQAGTS